VSKLKFQTKLFNLQTKGIKKNFLTKSQKQKAMVTQKLFKRKASFFFFFFFNLGPLLFSAFQTIKVASFFVK
jgi:hypothetical protein